MEPLPFAARLWLALTLPWKLLVDVAFAARVRQLAVATPSLPEPKPPDAPAIEPERDLDPALQLLAIFQREGRLVDFLQEDIAAFADAEIGAAARVVHEGCKRALDDFVGVRPIRDEAEGSAIALPRGYDPARHRVVGHVVGEPPFTGTLRHHGWVVEHIRLPTLVEGHDPRILAPAEVELA